jgi:hypothetical protein
VYLLDVEGLDFLVGKGTYNDGNNKKDTALILLEFKMPKVGGPRVSRIVNDDKRTMPIHM